MGYSSSPGFPITKYRVKNFKIYDVYYDELDNFNNSYEELFEKLESEEIIEYQFSFEHIEEWIGKDLITIKHKDNQDIFESAINEYQSTTALIDCENMSIMDGAILHSSYETTSFSGDYFIKLTPSNPEIRIFEEFYKVSQKYKEFIEVLCNIPLSFTDIEFLVHYKLVNEKRLPLIKGKYFVQHARKSKKWRKYSEETVTLSGLGQKFEKIINNWFNNQIELEFIVKEFTKNLHGDLYLEDQLIDAIRNLEVYSRNFRDFKMSKSISDIESDSRQILLDFINSSIVEECRSTFRSKLKNRSFEPSLHNRLKNLFDTIDECNQHKIFPVNFDKDLLIKKLIQTRNYYTHGDSKDKYPFMISDFNEMYETKLLLQEVLRYYIYQELNMKY